MTAQFVTKSCFATLALGLLVGCGGGSASVGGKVTHDGAPVTGGTLQFRPIAAAGAKVAIFDMNEAALAETAAACPAASRSRFPRRESRRIASSAADRTTLDIHAASSGSLPIGRIERTQCWVDKKAFFRHVPHGKAVLKQGLSE